MGSPHTLDQDRSRWGRHDDDPAGDGHARQLADQAFGRLNPAFGVPLHNGDVIARAQAQALEDQTNRGPRVRFAELLENDQPSDADRRRVIARRVELARQRGREEAAVARAEQAFDRLNPDFGVPADTTSRIGHRDVQQRERALSLGVRVAVHDSRQNDRDPVIWQVGQDYRAADAIQAAHCQPSRVRSPVERARAGAER
jgi:hypothetical protein